MTELRSVGKNAAYYAAASLASRIASVLLLPVYTSQLDTAAYGVMDLVSLTVDMAALLFVSGMSSGMQRFFFAAQTESERRLVVSSTFWLEAALGLAAAIALALAAPLAPLVGLRNPEHVGFVQIAAATFFFGVLSSAPMLLLQSLNSARTFLFVSLAKLLMQVTLNLYFLLYLRLGVVSMFYTGLIVNVVLGVVMCVWMVRKVGLGFSGDVARQLRAFGVPYQVTVAGSFILVFADRFILGRLTDTAQVGLYALAYQFGFLFSALSEVPFIRAWNPVRYAMMKLSSEERDEAYNRGLASLSFLMSALATGLISFSPFVLHVLTPTAFHAAAELIPVVVGAFTFQCLTSVVVFGIDASAKTRLFTIATWTSAVAAMVLYWILIPLYGAQGAAWATLIAYAIRFVATYRLASRVWPVGYVWSSTVRSLLVPTLAAVAVHVIRPTTTRESAEVGIAVSILALAALWRLALSATERESSLKYLRDVLVPKPKATA